MKKIVITGGLGYIGSELCKIYSGESWNNNITVIDKNFFSDRVNQLTNWNINFFQGNILDKNFVREHIEDADIVHHLAGITDVAYVKKDENKERDDLIKATAIEGTQKDQIASRYSVMPCWKIVAKCWSPARWNAKPLRRELSALFRPD